MTRSRQTSPYMDCLGRGWSVEKIDELLADREAHASAMSILAVSLEPDNGFNGGRALRIARLRYRREEPAALLCMLAVRLWDRWRAPDAAF